MKKLISIALSMLLLCSLLQIEAFAEAGSQQEILVENCHTMSEKWFADTQEIEQKKQAFENNESIKNVLESYFNTRERMILEHQVSAQASTASFLDSAVQTELLQRADGIAAFEENANLRIKDAEVTVLYDTEHIEYHDDGTITLYAYEWTFFDYDDLRDGFGGTDVSGFGVYHKIVLSGGQEECEIVTDEYDESDSFGVCTINESTRIELEQMQWNPTDTDDTIILDLEPFVQDSQNGIGESVHGSYYSGYNPDACVVYADQYVYHGAQGNTVYESYYNNAYANFNSLGGDCANYTSQSIYAGGMPQVVGSQYGTDGWFYITSTNRSATWTGVTQLRSWMAANRGTKVSATNTSVLKGSPVFYNDEHATICVGKNSAGTPIINSHNYDRYHAIWNYWSSGTTYTTVQLTSPGGSPSSSYNISDNGVAFICSLEGFSPTCYPDASQSSIGYGTKCNGLVNGVEQQPHAAGLHSITQEAALAEMKTQINSTYAPRVRQQMTGISMTQNQFDALTSLCYNTGGGTSIISDSPLARFLKGELTEAQAREQYAAYYIKSGGVVLQGLINRRNKEANYFFTGSSGGGSSDYSSTNPDDYTVPTRNIYYTSPNMTGADVAWVQAVLYQLGYSIEIDGMFGPASESVVKLFQGSNGLDVDGSVGPLTREKLIEKWEQKKNGHSYYFNYNPNGGSMGADNPTTVKFGESFTVNNTTCTRTGYHIGGWNVKRTNDNKWYVIGHGWCSDSTISSNGYEKKVYENGTTLSLDNSWTEGITGDGSYTFYAVWIANTCSITYNANGGSGAPAKQTYTYSPSGTISLSSVTPVKTNYTFLGWSQSSTATTASYAPGAAWNRSNDGNYTLYAVWRGDACTITYNANGGSGAPSAQTYYYAPSGTMTLSSTKPTRTYYTFLGWSQSSTATTASYSSGGSWSLSNHGNYTLYAVWRGNECTITYNANGGSGAPSVQTYYYAPSGTTTLSSTVPTRAGYTFLGWSLSSVATTATYSPGGSWDLNKPGNHTIFAVWKPNEYTVAYNANGGSGAPEPQTKYHDTNLTLSTVKPTKTYSITYNANGGTVSPAGKTLNCTFSAWNTAASGTGTSYESGGVYTANSAATLFAQWINPKAGTLAVPNWLGHTFLGWFTAQTGGTQITADSAINSNLTLYAHWTNGCSGAHNYQIVVTSPTCTEQGFTTHTCVNCGENYIDGYVSALGHNYTGIMTLPTCTEQGHTTYTCTRCGDSYVDNYTDALGHDWGEWMVLQAPTATENGVEQRTCARCGGIEKREIFAGSGVIRLSSERARPGGEVTVSVSMVDNPGVMVMRLKPEYDRERLQLIGYEDVGLTGWYVNEYAIWIGDGESTATGEVLRLKFKVLDNAEEGDAFVTLSYEEGDIANYDENNVNFAIEAGKVTVFTTLPGDITGDGNVNALDLLRLKKYLAGDNVALVGSADITGDGLVNALDLLRLKKYLAGDNVVIH